MSENDTDSAASERVRVGTYVPAWQRDAWAAHAEALGMTRSEFVRTMVQAGRQAPDIGLESEHAPSSPVQQPSASLEVGGEALADRVEQLIESEEVLDYAELLDAFTGGFEDRLTEAISELQSANRIEHDGRAGGYVVDG
jgi:hypothetical protein